MTNKLRRVFLFVLGVLPISQVCLSSCTGKRDVTGTATNVASPVVSTSTPISTRTLSPTSTLIKSDVINTPTVTIVTEALSEESLLVWADAASASSNAGDIAYHASQAEGEPNTKICGDFVTAWQPAEEAFEAWIELEFPTYILPKDIVIAQSFFPAQIHKVEVITLDEQVLTVFDADRDEMGDVRDICPVTRTFTTGDVDVLIRAVRIDLERLPDEPWTQIDAVGVNGWVSEMLPSIEPTQAWVEEDEEDFFAPRYFSNKNSVDVLLFAGDRLWAGGDGGLVAWDLGSLNAPEYQHVTPFATHALAYCDWEVRQLLIGGDQGIHSVMLPIFDIEPFVQPLDHPGDDGFGRVSAMACDDQKGQLWAGTLGHVSRYDRATQSWREWSWQDGLPDDTVRKISLIDGDVWIATASGVALFHQGENLEVFNSANSDLPCAFVHAIESDESGIKWMASSCGLLSFDGNTWRQWDSKEINGNSLSNIIMDIAVDRDASLWLGDAFGNLCQFDPLQKKCINSISAPSDDFSLDRLEIDSQGNLTVGSTMDGLYLFKDGKWISLQTDDQLLHNDIRAIAQTPDDHIWVANGSALQYFPADQPSATWTDVSLPDQAVTHSLFAANDGLWIGHTGGARFLPYLEEFEVVDIPVLDLPLGYDITVTAINKDDQGFVYFGLSTGLFTWDGSELHYEDLLTDVQRKNRVLPPRVNSIYAFDDAVWVGSSYGLHKFVNGSLRTSWEESLQSISSFYAQSVGVVSSNPREEGLLVAIGTELFSFDGLQFSRLLQLPTEIRNLVIGPNQIWIATGNSGFYSVPMDDSDAIYWAMADKNNALPESYGYQAVLISDPHTLWIGSSQNGLTRLRGMYGQ